MKRGTLGTNGMSLISAGTATNNGTSFYFSNDQLVINNIVGGGSQGAASTPAVLRDPSSWYHIVLSMDTTQTSFANGWAKIYINGVQQTLTQVSAPTQNSNTFMNLSTNAMWIARDIINSNYFGGYLTEINFIDGQALTPASFGRTNTDTGVWEPIAYSGTYGTNGFYLPFKTASQWSGYFDGTGDYASFSPTSALNAGTGNFTLEFWTFHLTSSTYQGYYYGGAVGSINFRRTSSNTIELAHDGVTSVLITSTTIPANQWVHVAVTRNSGTVRIFINGVSGGSVTYTGNFNSTGGTGTIGSITSSIYNLNGYISNLRLITGTALYTANFTPPTAQLTAVSGTQLLTCQSSTFVDNSTNAFTITAAGDARPQQFSPFTLDVTDDHSGQGNHWIPNNLDLRTTGAGADILVDSPTSYGTDTGVGGEVRGNYCTLNPLDKGTNATLANGNLFGSTSTTAWAMIRSTFAISSGKWYWEFTVATTQIIIGLAKSNAALANYVGADANGWGWYGATGNKVNGGTQVTYVGVWAANDVIGVSFDADVGTLVFYKNGTSQGTAYTGLTSGPYFPAISFSSASDNANANFGQRAFAYTAPSGFKALCTQNLTYTHTIGATSTTQANDYFNIGTWTGDNANPRTITGIGFQPDFTWIKCRSNGALHRLHDAVRGSEKILYSDSTIAEAATDADGTISAFTSDGFTLQGSTSAQNVNLSPRTYVAWNWNAGGSNQTISVGQYATSPANVPSIASTVRANTTSGFSIVTASASGTSPVTVGHGLGVAPSMVIGRVRNNTANWYVYHSSFSAQDYLVLNSAAAKATSSNIWDAAPTLTVFTIGNPQNGWNGGTAGSYNYVAYCFAPVAGYSAFGSYTGNGSSTDGVFIYLGFRPRYVLIKRTNTTENWHVMDTSRNPYNYMDLSLYPNLPNSEVPTSGHAIDFLSNGIKMRNTNTGYNASGSTYIYAAFAESPFKYSLAR
jgi:hypothetical protein